MTPALGRSLLQRSIANNNEVKQWLPDYHDNKTKQFYVLNANRQFQFAMCTECTMMPALGRPLLQRSTTPWTEIARISGVSQLKPNVTGVQMESQKQKYKVTCQQFCQEAFGVCRLV